jgi:serine/threonine protein kinase
MTDPHPSTDRLHGFAAGRLDAAAAAAVEVHLAHCPACWAVVEAAESALPLVTALRALPADLRQLAQEAPVREPVPPPETLPAELAAHPRYEVLEILGQGGMGVIYKARHRLMDRLVALKVIRPRLTASPLVVERFRQEARAVARLDHPNVVRSYDAEQVGSLLFLALEFVDGVDLAARVHQQGPLPIPLACEYARQVALGLEHAHARGLIHHDIKPSNLIATPEGRVKILDFGLASLFGAAPPPPDEAEDTPAGSLTRIGGGAGTPNYAAPEQACDIRLADGRADLYSLGCTLYFLLAGKPPFPGGSTSLRVFSHLVRPPPPLAALRPDVPARLQRLLDRLLAKDPAERFQHPAEVAAALTPLARDRRPWWSAAAAWLTRTHPPRSDP